ncbi:Os12g0285700 [Oryza sativa Japonica Group]|uniref:Os12g0285700 protein n=1 Tax=Oryza sativa subsp. japonica TaxID=39947 RepID=A0A0P0Y942_ORYSJ|nr:Os12g0285700 [Oryza sativa Japonica Group]
MAPTPSNMQCTRSAEQSGSSGQAAAASQPPGLLLSLIALPTSSRSQIDGGEMQREAADALCEVLHDDEKCVRVIVSDVADGVGVLASLDISARRCRLPRPRLRLPPQRRRHAAALLPEGGAPAVPRLGGHQEGHGQRRVHAGACEHPPRRGKRRSPHASHFPSASAVLLPSLLDTAALGPSRSGPTAWPSPRPGPPSAPQGEEIEG